MNILSYIKRVVLALLDMTKPLPKYSAATTYFTFHTFSDTGTPISHWGVPMQLEVYEALNIERTPNQTVTSRIHALSLTDLKPYVFSRVTLSHEIPEVSPKHLPQSHLATILPAEVAYEIVQRLSQLVQQQRLSALWLAVTATPPTISLARATKFLRKGHTIGVGAAHSPSGQVEVDVMYSESGAAKLYTHKPSWLAERDFDFLLQNPRFVEDAHADLIVFYHPRFMAHYTLAQTFIHLECDAPELPATGNGVIMDGVSQSRY